MPLAAVAGIGAGTSLIGGLLGSNASSNAASEQAQAANNAANLQYQASQNALGFQQQQWNTEQADMAPWLQSGTGALSQLDYLSGVSPQAAPGTTGQTSANPTTSSVPGVPAPTSDARSTQMSIGSPTGQTPTAALQATPPGNPAAGGYGSLLQPYGQTFTAPTAAEANASPAEQAELTIGNQQLQQSAAARGNLLTGGTAEALQNYGQNVAAENYQNVYNNAYNTYAAGYNQYQNQQNNTFNRLSALAGGGQTTASTLGSLGQSAANGVSSNLLNTASQMGQDTQNAAYQNASGMVNSANAWNSALGGTSNNLTQLAMLNQMYGGGSTPTLNTAGGMGTTGGYDYGAPPVNTTGLSAWANLGGY